MNIGNKCTVCDDQFISQTSTLYRTLLESKTEQSTVNSMCPINIMDARDVSETGFPDLTNIQKMNVLLGLSLPATPNIAVAGSTLIGAVTGEPSYIALTGRQQYALKNQLGFNNFQCQMITGQIPSTFFMCTDAMVHLGCGNSMNVKFQVNQNWFSNIIGIAGSK